MRRKFLDAIARHAMCAPGDAVCVAVSGGPDSVALLTLLHEAKDDLGIALSLCHVNHGLRGEASDGDERFVRGLAERFGLPCAVERVDVKKYRALHGGSTQTAARELRYKVFARLLENGAAQKIAVAHTADDDAETFLINLLRGAGPQGLAGIPPVRDERIVRPLLDVAKGEILALLKERGIDYRRDASNDDAKYRRNRVRNELIPLLEKAYNPMVRDTLRRTATVLGDMQKVVARLAEGAREKVERDAPSPDCVVIDCASFAKLDVAVQRELLRGVIRDVRKSTLGISFGHIETLRLAAVAGDSTGDIALPGMTASVAHGQLHCASVWYRKVAPFAYPWTGEGIAVAELACRVDVVSVDALPGSFPADCDTVYANAATLPATAIWRNRRDGDRFHPFGAPGTRKLKEFFIDAKVARWQRDSVLLLADGDEVLWAVGYRLSERLRVTPATQRILRLAATYGE